jgi:hypothetical protein
LTPVKKNERVTPPMNSANIKRRCGVSGVNRPLMARNTVPRMAKAVRVRGNPKRA